MINSRYPFQKSWRWHIVRVADFFLDFFKKRPPFPHTVKKILVIRLDQIGDTVCSTPVFGYLKRKFPEAEITALVSEETKAVFQSNPFIDHVVSLKANWLSQKKAFNFKELLRLVFQFRNEKFDLGYDLRGDIRNILLMFLAHVRFRVGYGIGGGEGLLHQTESYDVALHQVELNMRLVGSEVYKKDLLWPQIYLSEEEREDASSILDQRHIPAVRNLIAVHPEAGYPSKEWGDVNYKQLIQKLLENPSFIVLVFGVSNAKRITENLDAHQHMIDFVGKISLRQMMAMLSLCNVFIGNDSGPSHIAQALGVPCVIIASGTNEYDNWGIWQKPSEVLKHDVVCSPCYSRDCKVEGHPCMSHISVSQVFNSVQGLLI